MKEISHDEDHFVQSLARGLAVITAFGPDRGRLSLSEVARARGLTRAAARRYLHTLADLGYVRIDGRLFELSPRILELGYAYLSSLSLPRLAAPHLEWLVNETGESSSIAVLDVPDIVYVARVPTTRVVTVTIPVGTRFPAHATSMGHVLLAGLDHDALEAYLTNVDLSSFPDTSIGSVDQLRGHLDQVRKQGYSLLDREAHQGLWSLATPIRDRRGRVMAAVNISSHLTRPSKEKARREFLPALREATQRIDNDLQSI